MILFILENFKPYVILFLTVLFIISLAIIFINVPKRILSAFSIIIGIVAWVYFVVWDDVPLDDISDCPRHLPYFVFPMVTESNGVYVMAWHHMDLRHLTINDILVPFTRYEREQILQQYLINKSSPDYARYVVMALGGIVCFTYMVYVIAVLVHYDSAGELLIWYLKTHPILLESEAEMYYQMAHQRILEYVLSQPLPPGYLVPILIS